MFVYCMFTVFIQMEVSYHFFLLALYLEVCAVATELLCMEAPHSFAIPTFPTLFPLYFYGVYVYRAITLPNPTTKKKSENGPGARTCRLLNTNENTPLSTCTQQSVVSLCFFITLQGITGFGSNAPPSGNNSKLPSSGSTKKRCSHFIADTEINLHLEIPFLSSVGESTEDLERAIWLDSNNYTNVL